MIERSHADIVFSQNHVVNMARDGPKPAKVTSDAAPPAKPSMGMFIMLLHPKDPVLE